MNIDQFAEGAAKFSAGFDIISSSIGAYNKAKLQAAQFKAQSIGQERSAVAGKKNLEGERIRNAVIRTNMRRTQARTQGTIGAMSSGRGGGDGSTIADLTLMNDQDVEREIYYQQLGSTLRQEAIDSQIQQAFAMSQLANDQARIASKSAFGAALLTGVSKTIEYGQRIAAAIATQGASELARAGAAPQTKVGQRGNEVEGSIITPDSSGAQLGSRQNNAEFTEVFEQRNAPFRTIEQGRDGQYREKNFTFQL